MHLPIFTLLCFNSLNANPVQWICNQYGTLRSQDPLYGGEHATTAEVAIICILKYKLRALVIIRHGRKVPNTANMYTVWYDPITRANAYVAQRLLMSVKKGNTISASEALTGIMPTYTDFALPFLDNRH